MQNPVLMVTPSNKEGFKNFFFDGILLCLPCPDAWTEKEIAKAIIIAFRHK